MFFGLFSVNRLVVFCDEPEFLGMQNGNSDKNIIKITAFSLNNKKSKLNKINDAFCSFLKSN